MSRIVNSKSLSIINFSIVFYFVLIWLLNYYQIDFSLIGFFVELLSMPFLIAQFVFLFLGIRFLVEERWSLLVLISVLALSICTVITVSSFF